MNQDLSVNEIDASKKGVLEIKVNQGNSKEYIGKIKEMLQDKGYDVTRTIRYGNIYRIHFTEGVQDA
jgi:hypothetical protein|tara:strand:+ start:399 stop:599 length:201 start_codon:yes stop_codon:yes gene_type:complete